MSSNVQAKAAAVQHRKGLGLRMLFVGAGLLLLQIPYWKFIGLM